MITYAHLVTPSLPNQRLISFWAFSTLHAEFDQLFLFCVTPLHNSRVGTVADVSADGEGKVTSDGTGGGLQGVGSAQDGSTGLDGVQTLPNHTDDGARVHVLDESGEEGLVLQVLVVLLQVLLTGGAHLQADELFRAEW